MRIHPLMFRLLVLAIVFACAGDVFANEPAGEGKKDPTSFIDIKRWDLGIWTLAVFGLLFFILRKYAWGPIIAGLDSREQVILQARAEAEQVKAEAQKLHLELQAKLATANNEIRSMLDEARRDADQLRSTERAAGQADAQAERDRAKKEIAVARDQALQEIWTQAVQLATLISSKTIKRELSADDHRRLLDEALSELGSTVNTTTTPSARV